MYRHLHHKKWNRKQNMRLNLALSVLTMVTCFGIFCASTFAWFNCQRVSSIEPVISGNWRVNVSDLGEASAQNTVDYTCLLAKDDLHVLQLSALGSASTGYCVITSGETSYYTAPIPRESGLSLMVYAAPGTQLSFSASWGAPPEGVLYGGDAPLELSRSTYQEYTVGEGVQLEGIAAHYGVSASDILLYNGITELIVGETIKIPNTEVTDPYILNPEDPNATPAPSDDPDETPASSDAPDATPEPSDDPNATPAPSDDPNATPEPSDDPNTTPAPSDDPNATPVPSDDPAPTPAPTEGEPTVPSVIPDAPQNTPVPPVSAEMP